MAEEVIPPVTPAATPPVTPVIPEPQYTPENLPKSKTEWDALKSKDPAKWGELTQVNIDRLFRQNKEYEEKLRELETQAPVIPHIPQPTIVDPTGKYSIHNLPKSQEEWENLYAENPILFSDLRNYYTQSTTAVQTEFQRAQADARRRVQAEHPDMYLHELEADGKSKLDSSGKPVLKRDAVSGEPIFNPDSEKGKLWVEEYNRDPNIANLKDGPELLALRVERRLKAKGLKMVNEQAEAERRKAAEAAQVITDGVTPPPSIVHKFSSDRERIHVEGAIRRGVYKSIDDYFNAKLQTGGYVESNSMPNFTKA